MSQLEPPQKEVLLRYCNFAIYSDYLLCVLVTSAAEGRLPSMGLDYGAGKSTFAIWLLDLFLTLSGKFKNKYEVWDHIFNHCLIAFPWELERFYYTASIRHKGDPMILVYDDMQRTLGKDRSRDSYIRSLANRLTTSRQQLAIFIGTAPDISEIAYQFRFKFNFEIKIPRRGDFEIQRLKKWTYFQNPYAVQVTMPKDDASIGEFPALDKELDDRYKLWRHDANKRHDDGEGEWRLRDIRTVLTDEAKQLLEDIIQRGSLTKQDITTQRDMTTEMKLLEHCGLVLRFGDNVVPTKQGRKLVKLV